ncbi:serine/threonine protein kinase [Alkalihalobacterium alkalinitrilicum]|uniref:serine/threonine protein kinase n=1 Tax=Alkalihalobacterium alkalinitrilicum TaxID=427920 RepID=UPI0009949449|nr:serine/threonine protein kinase [Alkalihalobacterium alkalinitrilicum]
MKSFYVLANSVKFDHRMSIVAKDENLELIGTGKSAAVFKVSSTKLAIKVFYPQYTNLANVEADIYRKLNGIDYYPTLHADGPNYVVIDLIEGNTLYSCLNKGIEVHEKVINEVDNALRFAKKRGLNPSDVHLKNIFITPDSAVRIVDVARFTQEAPCPKWKDTKKAYYKFYRRGILPKKMPTFLLDTIGRIYRKYS